MTQNTADLARAFTWTGSKQTYYTVRLMVDRDLVDDCYRAYGYFRWADDIVDAAASAEAVASVEAVASGDAAASDDILSQSDDERVSFINRQKELINRLYRHERPDDLTPQEEMVADLISHDRGENSLLQSYMRNFLAILEFDAYRRGRLISQAELTWYSDCLGKATTDGILYFIGNGYPYPASEARYLGASAAHITHMLRDMVEDTADGYVNIPREYLEAHGIGPEDVDSPPFLLNLLIFRAIQVRYINTFPGLGAGTGGIGTGVLARGQVVSGGVGRVAMQTCRLLVLRPLRRRPGYHRARRLYLAR